MRQLLSSTTADLTARDDHSPDSRSLSIRERVIVAPCSGRFRPLPPETFTTEGEWVEVGQAVGEVVNGDEVTTVRSAFSGWMMGMLGLPGQPVKTGEALFWLWNSRWEPH